LEELSDIYLKDTLQKLNYRKRIGRLFFDYWSSFRSMEEAADFTMILDEDKDELH